MLLLKAFTSDCTCLLVIISMIIVWRMDLNNSLLTFHYG